MKVFLMAAGRGERLRELTEKTPKCLLPVGGEPLLQRWLDRLQSWKVEEVILNISHHADKIIKFLDDNANRWTKMTISVSLENKPLGTAKTLFNNRYRIKDNSCFGVVYADVWTAFNMRELINYHITGNAVATLGVYLVKDYSQKGAIIVRRGIVTEYEERPVKLRSPIVWSGIMVANSSALSFISEDMVDISYDLMPALVKTKAVRVYSIFDPVLDIGESVERYNKINRKVNNARFE